MFFFNQMKYVTSRYRGTLFLLQVLAEELNSGTAGLEYVCKHLKALMAFFFIVLDQLPYVLLQV